MRDLQRGAEESEKSLNIFKEQGLHNLFLIVNL